MTWKKEKLKPLGWFRSAGVNKLIDSNQQEVDLINYMDVYRNHKISSKIKFQKVTAKNAEITNANVLKGDVLFTPSSEKPTDIGHAGIVMGDLENTVYSYHLVRFRPYNPKVFNTSFLSYLLNTYETEKHFIKRATGTTRYTLSLSDFKSLEIEYPENPKEQTAIASILSKVDEAIEATQKSIKAAERLKKALMQNLLTGKLKSDGTWRTEDEFYEDEKFGKVPKGWIFDKVKNLTNRVTDGEHLSPDFQDSGSYLLSAEDILDDGVSFAKAKFVKQDDCKKFRKRCDPDFGDVLIVSRGAKIGRTCKVNTDVEFCLMGSVILIKPNNEILHGGFLAQYFKSYQAWVELQKLSGTTAQQAIYLTHIKKVRLIYPESIPEQELISTKLESFDIDIAVKQTKIKTLQRLKKSLIQNLLTGKVKLDVDKINKFLNG